MSEKVPCTACQTLIMPSTAERNAGLCMPCKNGNRENIEQAKAYYQKERELDKTCPFRALWRDIVVRVYDDNQGFHTLSEALLRRQLSLWRSLQRRLYPVLR